LEIPGPTYGITQPEKIYSHTFGQRYSHHFVNTSQHYRGMSGQNLWPLGRSFLGSSGWG